MKNDERRLGDWLDDELDRLAIEGDRPGDPGRAYASEEERALSDTVHRLQRLDAAQQGEPDPVFLRNLEQQLMPTNQISQPWSGPPLRSARRESLPAGTRLRGEPLGHGGSSRLSFFATLALVIAIVGATLVVTTWDRNGGTRTNPTSGGFAATGSDGTPAPGSTPGALDDITWALAFPEGTREASTGLLLVENGLVYRQLSVETGNEATNFSGVQAIRAADGVVMWEQWMPWSRNGFEVDAEGLYTVSEPNRIVALAPESGERLWDLALPSSIAAMSLRDGTLYIWDLMNTMTTVNATTGEVVWTTETGLDASFELLPTGAPLTSAGVIVGEQTVAAIAADGTLVGFDRESGESAWSVPGFSALNSLTTVTDEMALVLTTPDTREGSTYEPYPDRTGVGIDLAVGEIRWSITVSGEISRPVAPGGTGMFHLVADQVIVNESPAEASTPVVDSGGAVVVMGADVPDTTPVYQAGENGPTGNDFVFGINAQTGQITWQRSTNGAGYATLGISSGSSESLWAATYDGFVIRLAGESGANLDAPVLIPDPIVELVAGSLEEGIVASTRGGTLYAFGHVPPDEQG